MVPTSSQIIAKAMGLAPDGVLAQESGCCAYCGTPIALGDLCAPFLPGPSFMDDLSLACRGSTMSCGHCAILLSADALRTTGFGVFSAEGVWPFRKWADITRALREPPKPPFVMTYATANNQHMAWRAPVNLSRDLFAVRVGLRDLRIRRPVLLAAVDACARIAALMGIEATAKSLAHPFASLSSTLKIGKGDASGDHTTLRSSKDLDIAEIERAGGTDMQLLRNLGLGETWALRFLLSPGAGSDAQAPDDE